MLNFNSRQCAFDFCLDQIEMLRQKNDVTINIGNVSIPDLTNKSIVAEGVVHNYKDISTNVKGILESSIRNKDKVSIVLDELLMNGLKEASSYKSLDEIKNIKLAQSHGISFTILYFSDLEISRIIVEDQNGKVGIENVLHILDEKIVKPRLSGKFGAGFGFRVVGLYSNRIEFNIARRCKTTIFVDIPNRNKKLKNFSFVFRSRDVE